MLDFVVSAHYLGRLGEMNLLYRAAGGDRTASRHVAEICLRDFRDDLLAVEKDVEELRLDLADAGCRLTGEFRWQLTPLLRFNRTHQGELSPPRVWIIECGLRGHSWGRDLIKTDSPGHPPSPAYRPTSRPTALRCSTIGRTSHETEGRW
jgi:hypothetical protein